MVPYTLKNSAGRAKAKHSLGLTLRDVPKPVGVNL